MKLINHKVKLSLRDSSVPGWNLVKDKKMEERRMEDQIHLSDFINTIFKKGE